MGVWPEWVTHQEREREVVRRNGDSPTERECERERDTVFGPKPLSYTQRQPIPPHPVVVPLLVGLSYLQEAFHTFSSPLHITFPVCLRSKSLRAGHKIPSVLLVRESKEELLLFLARLGFVELPQSSVCHAIELEAHA